MKMKLLCSNVKWSNSLKAAAVEIYESLLAADVSRLRERVHLFLREVIRQQTLPHYGRPTHHVHVRTGFTCNDVNVSHISEEGRWYAFLF